MANILIFAPFSIFPVHFETELELAYKHLLNGDNVYVITCDNELQVGCFEKNSDPNICIKCQSRKKHGLSLIKHKNFFEIPLKHKPFHKGNIDFSKLSNVEYFKNFSIEGMPVGAFTISTLITELKEPNPRLQDIKNQEYLNLAISEYLAIVKFVENQIEKNNIHLGYLFNGRFFPCNAALWAFKNKKIQFYTHERSGSRTRYSLEYNTIPHDLEKKKNDILLTWKNSKDSYEEKIEIAKKWYHNRRGKDDQAWFSYIKNQKNGKLPANFNSDKKNISIYVSSEEEFVSLPGWENPIFKGQNDAISNILDYFENDTNFYFYIRVHPNLAKIKNSQNDFLNNLKRKNCTVIGPEEDIDTYELMDKSSQVIVFGSTMGVESTYWNRPSILVGRSRYEDLECTYVPENKEELFKLLLSNLSPKDKIGTYQYAFWEQTYGDQYIYYKPESNFKGSFLGVKIQSSYLSRLIYKVLSKF